MFSIQSGTAVSIRLHATDWECKNGVCPSPLFSWSQILVQGNGKQKCPFKIPLNVILDDHSVQSRMKVDVRAANKFDLRFLDSNQSFRHGWRGRGVSQQSPVISLFPQDIFFWCPSQKRQVCSAKSKPGTGNHFRMYWCTKNQQVSPEMNHIPETWSWGDKTMGANRVTVNKLPSHEEATWIRCEASDDLFCSETYTCQFAQGISSDFHANSTKVLIRGEDNIWSDSLPHDRNRTFSCHFQTILGL